MNRIRLVTLLILLTSFGAHQGAAAAETPAKETASKTAPRTDFTPEEFGIGRKHTANATCNKKIDKLLDEVRVCVNTRPEAECNKLRTGNNGQIGNLKLSRKCVYADKK